MVVIKTETGPVYQRRRRSGCVETSPQSTQTREVQNNCVVVIKTDGGNWWLIMAKFGSIYLALAITNQTSHATNLCIFIYCGHTHTTTNKQLPLNKKSFAPPWLSNLLWLLLLSPTPNLPIFLFLARCSLFMANGFISVIRKWWVSSDELA